MFLYRKLAHHCSWWSKVKLKHLCTIQMLSLVNDNCFDVFDYFNNSNDFNVSHFYKNWKTKRTIEFTRTEILYFMLNSDYTDITIEYRRILRNSIYDFFWFYKHSLKCGIVNERKRGIYICSFHWILVALGWLKVASLHSCK